MENWLGLSDLLEKVQELFEINLFDEGLSLLDQYKDIYRNEWEIHFLYSRAYSEQNKPASAIPQLKLALRFNKDNPDCLLGLFYAYTQLNQVQTGARYLLKAQKLYPDNELILNALIWYYSEANDFSKAVACYEGAESLLNYNPEALRNTGIAYERLGNFNKALLCFKMSLELDPDVGETRDLLADHYILRGEIHKSVALYKEYLQASPNNIRAMSRLVFCLSQNKQIQDAEKAANEIIRVYPNSPVGYVDLSYVYLNTNNTEKAIITAGKALDVCPIDAEARRVKGIAYSEQKSYVLAEQSFKEALSLAPDNPEIMRDYYHHLRNAGKYSEMEELVQMIIKQEYPYCMEDYWFFADYYLEMGQKLKAFHYLNKAYRCMPGEKDVLPPMAEILLDMGHTSYAVPMLRRYIETKGWDDTMKELSKHKKMKGKWSQEGFRFLQFYAQKPVEFRHFIFGFYVRKFFLLSFYALSALVFILSYLYFNIKGVTTVLTFYVSLVLSFKGTMFLINKKKLSQ